MANEGSTEPTVNGFCEKHQPNQAVQYAGCWVCSRNEDTEMLREVLRAFGWMKDKEAGWYLAGDADDCPKFYDFHDAVAAALDDYDALREAHKKAHLYGAGQKVRADKLEAENLRVRGLLQRRWVSVEERLPEKADPTKSATGTMVLVVHGPRKPYVTPSYFESDGRFYWFGGGEQLLVTHWMPLPTFPQSSDLVPSGAESADIGKIDGADKKYEYEGCICRWVDGCPVHGEPDVKVALAKLKDAMAGSAETGGEPSAGVINVSGEEP